MTGTQIHWRAEVAQVQREIACFRADCLPAFFGGSAADLWADGPSRSMKFHILRTLGRQSDWRAAARRLADHLPLRPGDAPGGDFDRDEFEPFLFQPATPGYAVRDGRITWRVELFVPIDVAVRCPELGGDPGDDSDPWELFRERLPAAKAWTFAPPLDRTLWGDKLCFLLPFVADLDPEFARLALDLETWRGVVRADRAGSEERRERNLRMVDGCFGRVVNNALLHVLGALANNHFLKVRDYLDHPHLRGGYTHLMPHYLFAVLVEKVALLRELAAEEGA